MNKGEAERCLELGRTYLKKHEYEKAIKFLDKSLRLFPLPGVEEMKARAQAELDRKNAPPPSSSTSNGTSSSSSEFRHRRTSSSSSMRSEGDQPSGGKSFIGRRELLLMPGKVVGGDSHRIASINSNRWYGLQHLKKVRGVVGDGVHYQVEAVPTQRSR